jgi:hypothetical protein
LLSLRGKEAKNKNAFENVLVSEPQHYFHTGKMMAIILVL